MLKSEDKIYIMYTLISGGKPLFNKFLDLGNINIHISYKGKQIRKHPEIMEFEIKSDIYNDLLLTERRRVLETKIPKVLVSEFVWYFSQELGNKVLSPDESKRKFLIFDSVKEYISEYEILLSGNSGKKLLENQFSILEIMNKYEIRNVEILCQICFTGVYCDRHKNLHMKETN